MGLLDRLKNQAVRATSPVNGGNKSTQIVFQDIPRTVVEFTALHQAAMQNPFDTAAMFVVAMCAYPQNNAEALAMLNYLKGPQPISDYEKQFIADRMRGKDYLPFSFFAGAAPANNYTPVKPYTISVSETPYSYQEQSYAKLVLQSSGADSPRPVQLRLAKDNRWYLWEQFLLSDIRQPEDSNPWA